MLFPCTHFALYVLYAASGQLTPKQISIPASYTLMIFVLSYIFTYNFHPTSGRGLKIGLRQCRMPDFKEEGNIKFHPYYTPNKNFEKFF